MSRRRWSRGNDGMGSRRHMRHHVGRWRAWDGMRLLNNAISISLAFGFRVMATREILRGGVRARGGPGTYGSAPAAPTTTSHSVMKPRHGGRGARTTSTGRRVRVMLG